MEIVINEKTYKVKYGFKALMIYEKIEEKAFEPKKLGDIILFFYCCLLSANPELNYEEFIDWLDDNPNAIEDFSDYLGNVIEATTLKKAVGKENQ